MTNTKTQIILSRGSSRHLNTLERNNAFGFAFAFAFAFSSARLTYISLQYRDFTSTNYILLPEKKEKRKKEKSPRQVN